MPPRALPYRPRDLPALVRRSLRRARNAGRIRLRRRAGPGPETGSGFEQALEFTESLPDEMAEAFRGVRSLYSPVMGMLFNAAQRLIDATARGRPQSAADTAVIRLCNRLVNESFAGYVLLSHGLPGAGLHQLRSAIETTNLAILFVVAPERAEPWLRGRRYTPGEVRRLLDSPEEFSDWYGRLSEMSHANYAATRTSVFELADGVEALSYGAYAAPRTMAGTALDFLWGALTFLRLFYRRYAAELDELSLLWPPGLSPSSDAGELTWDRFLDVFEEAGRRVQDGIDALPEDEVPRAQLIEQVIAELAATGRRGAARAPEPPASAG